MSTPTSQILTEIAEVAGIEATAKLVALAGGRSVRVPAKAEPEHWLTVALGTEAADKLCRVYAGSTVWIPKNDAEVRRLRDRQIVEDRRAGTTIRALAGKYRLTDRTIYNILGAVEEG